MHFNSGRRTVEILLVLSNILVVSSFAQNNDHANIPILLSIATSTTNRSRYYPDDDYEIVMGGHIRHGEFPTYFNTPKYNSSMPNNTVFRWTFAADEDCLPSLDCSIFNLAPHTDKKCTDQSFEISDGVYGRKSFCGTKGPQNLVAADADGLRDLYVTFRGFRNYNSRFKCQVHCGRIADERNKPLPKVVEPKVNSACYCGQKAMQSLSRIIGGHDTYVSEFPWVAAMVVAKTRQPYCIGSVINDRMILTAGHCFKGKFRKPESTQVIINGYEMDAMPNINVIKPPVVFQIYDDEALKKVDAGNNSFRFNVDKIIIHPLYVSNTSDFDAALMVLSSPINLTAFGAYSPICLPKLTDKADLYTDKTAHISGWGLPSTTALGTNTLMKKISMDVWSSQECNDTYGPRLANLNHQVCAAFDNASEDSCAGDSGGPLITEWRRQVWYQIGIISWGDGCASWGHPGVYYRTTAVNQWIRHISNMKEAMWCEVPEDIVNVKSHHNIKSHKKHEG